MYENINARALANYFRRKQVKTFACKAGFVKKNIFLSYFFVKKIPLSRRVGYVMGSSVSGSVRNVCMSHQSDWIYY